MCVCVCVRARAQKLARILVQHCLHSGYIYIYKLNMVIYKVRSVKRLFINAQKRNTLIADSCYNSLYILLNSKPL